MARSNTHTSFGSVSKTFHWLTALLILTTIPVGLIASNMAQQLSDSGAQITEAAVNRTFLLFSLHKTIGVTLFFVALVRIAWAFSQPKPRLLNGDNWAEAVAAETVHWLLYGSLVAVPLTGWVHHAATTGFAPIWWPLGQNLPLVPKSEAVAEFAAGLHYVLQWVLIAAIALHVAGALKHHVLDGDATLRRMLPGSTHAQPTPQQPGHKTPIALAFAIWAAALAVGALTGAYGHTHNHDHTHTAAPPIQSPDTPTPSNWTTQSGTLDIKVTQMNAPISGQFSEWSAEIQFDETPQADGTFGTVTVTVQIASLTLGGVTTQALAPDMLGAADHPTAVFSGDIHAAETGYIAMGTLTLRGQNHPAQLPFSLDIADNTATATGGLNLDRRSFGIGKNVTDAGSLEFEVPVTFTLTATRL